MCVAWESFGFHCSTVVEFRYIVDEFSWHDLNADGFGRCNNAFAQTLQAQARQSCLCLLDLCNLVNVFQCDGANGLFAGILGSPDLVLDLFDLCSLKQ